MKKIYSLSLVSIAFSALVSCSEILEIDPPTDTLTEEEVYGNAANIKTAFTGLYSWHIHQNASYYQYLDLYLPLMSDELKSDNTSSYGIYYQNTYLPTLSMMGNIWSTLYESIYQTNNFIEHV